MATKKKQYVDNAYYNSTMNDIYEAEQRMRELQKIKIGQMLMVPTELSECDENRRKTSARDVVTAKFRVVGKTRNMLVCERLNGTKECFTFADLMILEKKHGGRIDGKLK